MIISINRSGSYVAKWAAMFTVIVVTIVTSCKKFVQIDPPSTALTRAVVYGDDLSAASAMTSIYYNMMYGFSGLSQGTQSISCLTGLTADEFKDYSSTFVALGQCYTNTLSSSSAYFWTELFNEIHVANAVLEGLSVSSTVTPLEKQQLIGEAKFMRAFFDYYGTNLFGDFPLVTSTSYETNNVIHRSSQAQVYQQVISDLRDAESRLGEDFVTPTGGTITAERVRPNKWAAAALLARAYLFSGSWDSAEAQSTQIINSGHFGLVGHLDSVFLKNSTEAIWQLQPVRPGYNTLDAYYFVLHSVPGSGQAPVGLSASLLSTFDSGDQRLAHWVHSFSSGGRTYYYPYKYKANKFGTSLPVTEYLMVLRLAEQYLIRAEARAQKGNLLGAAADLNTIRMRAGLDSTQATTQSDLLTAIYHERQVELFTEWGHRWFDLKRTGNINAVMGSPGNVCQSKGGTWNTDWALFPIPLSERTVNPNLIQNPGYN